MHFSRLACKPTALIASPALALLIGIVSGAANANESARQAHIHKLYEQTGVDAHLLWVQETVKAEAAVAWHACETKKPRAGLEETLDELLVIESLRAGFVKELDERISDALLTDIISFTESDLGKRVYRAEAASLELDEQLFGQLLSELNESGAIDQARSTAVKHMLADTGAVYFLSALNTELSALVIMASVCSNTDEQLKQAETLIREERGAEALYRSFMRQELVQPAYVVYRELESDDIEAISEFAKSDAGNAYYSAIIKGVRSLLSTRLEQIKLSLQSTPKLD